MGLIIILLDNSLFVLHFEENNILLSSSCFFYISKRDYQKMIEHYLFKQLYIIRALFAHQTFSLSFKIKCTLGENIVYNSVVIFFMIKNDIDSKLLYKDDTFYAIFDISTLIDNYFCSLHPEYIKCRIGQTVD